MQADRHTGKLSRLWGTGAHSCSLRTNCVRAASSHAGRGTAEKHDENTPLFERHSRQQGLSCRPNLICIVCLQCGHGRRASSGAPNRRIERTAKGEVAMLIRSVAVYAATFVAVVTIAHPIQALTMQECSTKYKAAQAAGTLKGMKWNDFRKAECGPDASAAAPATVPTNTAPAAPLPPHAQRQLSRRRHQRLQAMQCSPPRCHRNTPASPQAKRACTPALINTMPTRRVMPTAGSFGSKKAAAITASATGTLRAEAKAWREKRNSQEELMSKSFVTVTILRIRCTG